MSNFDHHHLRAIHKSHLPWLYIHLYMNETWPNQGASDIYD